MKLMGGKFMHQSNQTKKSQLATNQVKVVITKLALMVLVVVLAGCGNEVLDKAGYEPLDTPLEVKLENNSEEEIGYKYKYSTNTQYNLRLKESILDAIPDQAIKVSIAKIEADGNLKFKEVGGLFDSGSYRIFVDFIRFTIKSIPFKITNNSNYVKEAEEYNNKLLENYQKNQIIKVNIKDKEFKKELIPIIGDKPKKRSYIVTSEDDNDCRDNDHSNRINVPYNGKITINGQTNEFKGNFKVKPEFFEGFNNKNRPKNAIEVIVSENDSCHYMPVYVGIGVRLIANLKVTGVNLNLSSFKGIESAINFGSANGDLYIQTLGISGENIANSLTLPVTVSEESIQEALQSMKSIMS